MFLLIKSNEVEFVRASTLSWILPVIPAHLAAEDGFGYMTGCKTSPFPQNPTCCICL